MLLLYLEIKVFEDEVSVPQTANVRYTFNYSVLTQNQKIRSIMENPIGAVRKPHLPGECVSPIIIKKIHNFVKQKTENGVRKDLTSN